MSECVFCEIVAGKTPCLQVFEDDLVKAFLDLNPVSDGHILVIPKEHFENIFTTPDEVLDRISEVCKRMAILCKDKLGATGVNILNASGRDAQQSVFHLHFHVIPRFEDDGLDLWFHGKPKTPADAERIRRLLLS